MGFCRNVAITAFCSSLSSTKVNGLPSRRSIDPDFMSDLDGDVDFVPIDNGADVLPLPHSPRSRIRLGSRSDSRRHPWPEADSSEDIADWCMEINDGELNLSRPGDSIEGLVIEQVGESFIAVDSTLQPVKQGIEHPAAFRDKPDPRKRMSPEAVASMAQRRMWELQENVTRLSREKKAAGVSFAKLNAQNLDTQTHCSLTIEEVRFHRCPPGEYMDTEERRRREARLRIAVCKAKERGWEPWVAFHNYTMNYKDRGFATFESALYPKPPSCRTVPGQAWLDDHKLDFKYRPDQQPSYMPKDVCAEKEIEFHRVWKVASSTLPNYLRCEIDCDWEEVDGDMPVPEGTTVVEAVRNPMSRWLSGMGELLQRVINGYCPGGPCTKEDGWFDTTKESVWYSTNWFKKVAPDRGGYTPDKLKELVQDFVHDTLCNYDYYAAAHVSTQSSYGFGPGIDKILKLENIDADVSDFLSSIGHNSTKDSCTLTPTNVQACKPQISELPSSHDVLEELSSMPELVEDLCLIYAQDFVCFDYELPDACKMLF